MDTQEIRQAANAIAERYTFQPVDDRTVAAAEGSFRSLITQVAIDLGYDECSIKEMTDSVTGRVRDDGPDKGWTLDMTGTVPQDVHDMLP